MLQLAIQILFPLHCNAKTEEYAIVEWTKGMVNKIRDYAYQAKESVDPYIAPVTKKFEDMAGQFKKWYSNLF